MKTQNTSPTLLSLRGAAPSGAMDTVTPPLISSRDFWDSARRRKVIHAPYIRRMMTPAQCRAARGLLDWSQHQLAESAHVGNTTICNFESGKATPRTAKVDVMRRALKAGGVIFLDGDGGGPGVRLRGDGASRLATASLSIEELNAENDE